MMTRGQASKSAPISPGKPVGDRADEILESIRKSNENSKEQFTLIFNKLQSIEENQKTRLDAQDKKISELESKNEKLETDLFNATQQLSQCQDQLKKAETRISENEAHGRRLNLVFGNVPETKDEDIRQTISRVLIDSLKIPEDRVEEIILRDAHRLGRSKTSQSPEIPAATKPRNIIIAFLSQFDRNFVYSQAKHLKGSNISIRPDLVKEMALIRDNLLLQRQVILKHNKKLYVQLTYRSYSKPVLLVKVANEITEFKPDMNLEILQEVGRR